MTENGSNLPLLFLRDIVMFPGMIVPLFIGRAESIRTIDVGREEYDDELICVAQRDASLDEVRTDNAYSVGVRVKLLQKLNLPDGTYKVLLEGLERVSVEEAGLETDHYVGRYIPHPYDMISFDAVALKAGEILSELEKYVIPESKDTRKTNKIFLARFAQATSPVADHVSSMTEGWRQETYDLIQDPNKYIFKYDGGLTHNLETDFIKVDNLIHPEPEHEPHVTPLEHRESRNPWIEHAGWQAIIDTKDQRDAAKMIDMLASQMPLSDASKQTLLEQSDRRLQLDVIQRLIRQDFNEHQSTDKKTFQPELHEIFISHANSDKSRIKPLVAAIVARGYRVFIDRPDAVGMAGNPMVSGIKSGPFRTQLSDALQRTSCVLTLWSGNAVQASRTELHEEAAHGKTHARLVQVSIDPPDDILSKLPIGFKEWQLLDLHYQIGALARGDEADLSSLFAELEDVAARNDTTQSPLAPWGQASKSVKLAVINEVLRTVEKPPPAAPDAPVTTLNTLRDRMLGILRKIQNRLERTQHPIEEDVKYGIAEMIQAFDKPLEQIDSVIAPSIGEQINLFERLIGDDHIRREIADHLAFSIPSAARAYRDFVNQWNAWKDQLNDPAMFSVTPENADRTRAAADLVTEFARNSPNIVHQGVPEVLDAMRRLIHPKYHSNRLNDYRYLNAIGEGLRAIWDEGSTYLETHWSEIQKSLELGESPTLGPFNEFVLEMGDALEQLSCANPELFGWLFVRLGYLKRLKSGKLDSFL